MQGRYPVRFHPYHSTYTLPLLTPGILSIGIYMLMIMVQAFEGPLAIGLTAGVPVLSVYIYVLSGPKVEPPIMGWLLPLV